jgi:hypothetical protein
MVADVRISWMPLCSIMLGYVWMCSTHPLLNPNLFVQIMVKGFLCSSHYFSTQFERTPFGSCICEKLMWPHQVRILLLIENNPFFNKVVDICWFGGIFTSQGSRYGEDGAPTRVRNSFNKYLTLRSISSINNPQNSEMKICEIMKLTCWKSS